ncbi:unnamed protein product, partial [Chrysoparadoxa australica]
ASCQTGGLRTLSLAFMLDSSGLIQAGDGFITFWTIRGHNLVKKPAVLGDLGKLQIFYDISWDGTAPVISTYDGYLYRFLGRRIEAAIKAHEGGVLTMSSTNEGIVTGGQDGFVKLWGHSLQCKTQIDMNLHVFDSAPQAAVRTVSWDNERDRILVGTITNELFEFSATSGETLNAIGQAHGGKELWGLACNPVTPEYATVGEDKVLRVWDVYSHKCAKSITLEMPSRALCYSPDGEQITVGFGMMHKESSKQFDGKWVVLKEDDFSILHEARDSQKFITDIKYALDGSRIAMGSFDNKIYVYDCAKNYTLSAMITTHNSPVTAFDFSEDGRYLRSTCAASELFYFEADTGMVIPSASRLKNIAWASQTTLFSWAVQGVWPPEADATDISTLEATLKTDNSNKAVATGDSFGRLRLLRYPSLSAHCIPKTYRGHGGKISRTRWAMGDSHLITTGAQDRSIMQWRHERDDLGASENLKIIAETQSALAKTGEGTEEVELVEKAPDAADSAHVAAEAGWLKNLVEPSYAVDLENDSAAPLLALKLETIHGILQQGRARGSIHFNRLGELVYSVSTRGIVFSKCRNMQRFYTGHAEEIASLTVSPNLRLVASSPVGQRPRISIWDACSCAEMTLLPEAHRQGVCCLSFNQDNTKLVSVGMDVDHTLIIWSSSTGDWFDAEMQAVAKGDRGIVNFAHFTGPGAEFQLASGGKNHVKFWSLDGRCLTSRLGILAKIGVVQTMVCGAALSHARFLTGAESGHLYIWKNRWLEKTVRAHQSCIQALHSNAGGIVTGADDGFVKLWSHRLEHLKTYDLSEAPIPPLAKAIRSVCSLLDFSGTEIIKMCVGTEGSEVYEISAQSGSMILVQEGHFDGELWGIDTHPLDPDLFATVGDDHTVRVWSISLKRVLRKAYLDSACRAVAWSPDGNLLLVGLGGPSVEGRSKKEGAFILLDAMTLAIQFEGRDSRNWIRACAFSPDGLTIALGSQDHKIYLYDSESLALRSRCQQHSAPIMNIDFSTDSAYVQSDAAVGEHLYHSSLDGNAFTVTAQLKHIKWASWNCTYGWPVQGIHNPGSTVTSVNRNADQDLVATSSCKDGGLSHLRVLKYPVLQPQAGFVEARGHAGPIAGAKFTCDSTRLISVGRHDRSLFVWQVNE